MILVSDWGLGIGNFPDTVGELTREKSREEVWRRIRVKTHSPAGFN
jgi:hypothetical protein